jgi:hypothetical protein
MLTIQIFQTSLYVLRNFETAAEYGDKTKYGSHERVRKFYGEPDLERLMEKEINNRRGKMLITGLSPSELLISVSLTLEQSPRMIQCVIKFELWLERMRCLDLN